MKKENETKKQQLETLVHPIKKVYLKLNDLQKERLLNVWLELTGKDKRTFYHRLDRPYIFEVVLFEHLLDIDLGSNLISYYPKIQKTEKIKGQLTAF